MWCRYRFAASIIVWVALALPLTAASVQVRGDPPPQPARPLSASDDARLEQKVTSRAEHRPLRPWLTELGRQAGVQIRVAADYEDRAITARIKEVPLGRLLDSIAALYADRWTTQTKKGVPVYLLEASEARRARQRRLLQLFEETVQSGLIEVAREEAEKGPPEWLLESYGPEGRDYGVRYFKAQGAVLSLLGADAVAQLFAGERIQLRLSQTTGRAADILWNFAEGFAMPDASGWKPQQRANALVQFLADPYVLEGSPLRGLPLRRLAFTFGGPSGVSSSYAVVIHPDELAERLERRTEALRRGEEQDAGERRQRGGPVLQQKVPDQEALRGGASPARSALLVALADALDVSILSDSHTTRPPASPRLSGVTLEEALSALCDAHSCYWRADAGVIRVRSRHWWLDDAAEPPATAVDRWGAKLSDAGRLDLEECLEIAALTPDQQERLALRHPETRSAFSPWLRFYAGLSRAQRGAAGSQKGLPLWKVSRADRRVLTRPNLSVGGPLLGNVAAEETLHGGAALLRVTEDRAAPAENERAPVRALTFLVDPVPDVAGHTHGVRLRVNVPLPRRDIPRKGSPAAPGAPR